MIFHQLVCVLKDSKNSLKLKKGVMVVCERSVGSGVGVWWGVVFFFITRNVERRRSKC